MFTGEYTQKMDTKGRTIVPAKFREELGTSVVVTRGLDGCLFAYSKEAWHALEEKDVYKRQKVGNAVTIGSVVAGIVALIIVAAIVTSFVFSMVNSNKIKLQNTVTGSDVETTIAVSYTHLDVYKRQ